MGIRNMTNEEVYKNYYVKLPKFIATILASVAAVVGVLDVLIATELLSDTYVGILSFLVGKEEYTSAIFAIIVWAFITFLLACGLHIILKISFSQKIMIIERLTEIRNKE